MIKAHAEPKMVRSSQDLTESVDPVTGKKKKVIKKHHWNTGVTTDEVKNNDKMALSYLNSKVNPSLHHKDLWLTSAYLVYSVTTVNILSAKEGSELSLAIRKSKTILGNNLGFTGWQEKMPSRVYRGVNSK